MKDESRNTGSNTAPEMPFGLPDFTELVSQMQIPGVDVEQLMRDGTKNIEALQQANMAVVQGWQALAQKQAEIFQQNMQRWRDAMTPGDVGTPAEGMEKQSQLAREAFEKALADMRELAEIASESQGKALEIMRERFDENMKQILSSGQSPESGK